MCVCVCACYRVDGTCTSPHVSLPGSEGGGGTSEQRLQVKIQAFEEKMGETRKEEEVGEVEENSPAPQRRYSLSQAVREERREMRFNRSATSLQKHDSAEYSLIIYDEWTIITVTVKSGRYFFCLLEPICH